MKVLQNYPHQFYPIPPDLLMTQGRFGRSYWKRSWKASLKGNEEVAMDNWLPSHGWLWIWIVCNAGTYWWVGMDFLQILRPCVNCFQSFPLHGTQSIELCWRAVTCVYYVIWHWAEPVKKTPFTMYYAGHHAFDDAQPYLFTSFIWIMSIIFLSF